MLENKICIGTAQFCMNYGVSNFKGKTSNIELDKIFSILKKKKFFLDTALSYKNCDNILSNYNLSNLNIITKLPTILRLKKIKKKITLSKIIEQRINQSLNKLRIKSFYGLLIHNADDMLSKNSYDIYRALIHLKKEKKVKKIGISIYDFDKMVEIIKKFKFDIVQCPYNLIDRRLEKKKYINTLKKKKIEIHVRSIFLQGLLLMNKRPKKFDKWNKLFKFWDKITGCNNTNRLKYAAQFVLKNNNIKKFVVGFENAYQLNSFLKVSRSKTKESTLPMKSSDLQLINPSNWNLK